MTLSIQPKLFSIDTHKKRYTFHQKNELKKNVGIVLSVVIDVTYPL
jgi:hypothetical protein